MVAHNRQEHISLTSVIFLVLATYYDSDHVEIPRFFHIFQDDGHPNTGALVLCAPTNYLICILSLVNGRTTLIQ